MNVATKSFVARQPRIYPNLNPAAAIPVDRGQIFQLESFFDHFRLQRKGQHGHSVPNAKYVFVRMGSGQTLLHSTYRHPVLAEGKPVIYAGEACFDNGRLTWWSNGSGNYRPDPDHAEQAGLPMDRFFTFEAILKGLHKSIGSKQSFEAPAQMQPQRSSHRSGVE